MVFYQIIQNKTNKYKYRFINIDIYNIIKYGIQSNKTKQNI